MRDDAVCCWGWLCRFLSASIARRVANPLPRTPGVPLSTVVWFWGAYWGPACLGGRLVFFVVGLILCWFVQDLGVVCSVRQPRGFVV